MTKAAIFDMDGVLVNSEDYWKRAEKEVFATVGVKVTEELSEFTAKMTTEEVTEFWYNHKPWKSKTKEQVEQEVINYVGELIKREATPLPGVIEIMHFLRSDGFKIGIATNSPESLIPAVIEKLGISDFIDVYSSSENELNTKPDPAVYLSAARKLNVATNFCIAFDDSKSGIISAKRSGMKTIALNNRKQFNDISNELADLKIDNLKDFNDSHLRVLFN
ncbi:hexitol phosphatase HxpB [Puteibacter caeruleilacunae]|nr:hexitol phosphatase HxpB [Puteibacter caeruleilacunae]